VGGRTRGWGCGARGGSPLPRLSTQNAERDQRSGLSGYVPVTAFLCPLTIIGCARCAMRAEEAAEYVDAMRAGAIMGNFDVDG